MASSSAQAPTTAPIEGDEDRCFCCPYYRHDRMLHEACAGRKLKRIKDVKAHLREHHRLPLYCPICGYRNFADAAARDGHVRAGECVAPPGGFKIQGLDSNQMTLLERRANRKLSTNEQWMEIWDILFPDIPRPLSALMGDYVEEYIGMVWEHWNAHAQALCDKAAEAAAGLLANHLHVTYQAGCTAVVKTLLTSLLALNAGINGRAAPALDLDPGTAATAAVPGAAAQAAEAANAPSPTNPPPQRFDPHPWFDPEFLIAQGILDQGDNDAAVATGFYYGDNDPAGILGLGNNNNTAPATPATLNNADEG